MHLGRFLHFSQKVVRVTVNAAQFTEEKAEVAPPPPPPPIIFELQSVPLQTNMSLEKDFNGK